MEKTFSARPLRQTEFGYCGASSYHLKPGSFEDFTTQRVLHGYCRTCQIPKVDRPGKQVRTYARGKLGERFPQPSETTQTKPEKGSGPTGHWPMPAVKTHSASSI